MKILNRSLQSAPRLLRQPSLLLCILFDFIGYASYSIPILGEVADIIWAPISAVIFMMMFGGWKGAMGGMFNFIEEILPGTDIIPSFTIMWFMRNAENRKRGNWKPGKTAAR
jgi:hypothetical protein